MGKYTGIHKIISPDDIVPTLVVTDMSRLAVADGNGLRRFTIREGLRLFGYPESYEIRANENEAFDLLGNTVAIPVVKAICTRVSENIQLRKEHQTKSIPAEALSCIIL